MKAGASELRRQAEGLRSQPSEVAALVEASRPTLDGISSRLADGIIGTPGPMTRFGRQQIYLDSDTNQKVLGDLSAVSELATGEGRDVIAGSLAGQVARAVPKDSAELRNFGGALHDLASRGQGAALDGRVAEKLINGLDRVQAGNAVLDAGTDAVKSARETADKKASLLAKTEARLGAELTRLGPALTPEQTKSFTSAFWTRPDNAQIRTDASTSMDRLSQVLASSSSQLEQLGIQGDTGSVKELWAGYKSLAGTIDHADEALAFAGRINQSPDLAHRLAQKDAFGPDFEKKLGEEIVGPALPNAQAKAIAASKSGSYDEAMSTFSGYVKQLKKGKALVDLPGKIDKFGQDVAAIRAGTYTVDQTKKLLEGWSSKGVLDRSIAVATVGFGLYDLKSDIQNGDAIKAIKDTLSTTKGGIELTSGLLHVMGRAGAATKVASVGSKLIPYLSLGADVITGYQDLDALRDGVSPGDVVNLVSDLFSLGGDVASFVPGVGTAVKEVTGVAGLALHFIGDALNGGDPSSFNLSETADILEKTQGLDEGKARALIGSTQEGWGGEMARLGLKPEQIHDLLTRNRPPLFAFSDGLGSYMVVSRPNSIFNALAAFGLSGDDAYAFLSKYGGAQAAFDGLSNGFVDPQASLGRALDTGDFSRYRENALRMLPGGIADELRRHQGPANRQYFD
jgi:hypothetical protein